MSFEPVNPLVAAERLRQRGILVYVAGLTILTFLPDLVQALLPLTPEPVPMGDEDLIVQIIGACVLAPPVETFLLNLLPMRIARALRGGVWIQILAGSIFFGLAHFVTGPQTVIAATYGGLLFTVTLVVWEKQSAWTAFWIVSAIHGLHNLLEYSVLAWS